ncbi:hypothetical protein ACTVNX_03625 [Serratia nevei]|uniref:hypothetical protein n=1 Tax=Serratia TaxID=613 RepID=UPI0018D8874A|nr:hypothetical protein [Serratia marcescens]MBH2871196.1 hypothetical protein [Serratia marcescens]MBI6126343.1 hypothetical protein [Serratia marcescens]MBN5185121.1 hypothetical protein [Serratia marcescens]MBN5194899.1 hypothetical protein [Serratia marcescens]MBN5301080.1 hypothetical protein [Serratia marcescens]
MDTLESLAGQKKCRSVGKLGSDQAVVGKYVIGQNVKEKLFFFRMHYAYLSPN